MDRYHIQFARDVNNSHELIRKTDEGEERVGLIHDDWVTPFLLTKVLDELQYLNSTLDNIESSI